MDKKLTHRQKQFLSRFLDFYHEANSPIFYGALAEKLGIAKVTTYEMLRLLEENGLVKSDYDYDQHGPGRPNVVFYPTQKAIALMDSFAGDPQDLEEWTVVKNRLLQQLLAGKMDGYDALLSDLLVRIPDRKNPLIYVTELTTAILITLSTIPKSAELVAIMERLKRIGLPGEIGLSALSGVSLALSILERINRRFSTELLTQINNYETMLSKLNDENLKRASDFAREVTKILGS